MGVVGKGAAFDQSGHYYGYDENSTKYNMYTNSKGEITIKDLPFGTYKLVEIKAPEGYNLPESHRQVSLSASTPKRSTTIQNDKAGGYLRLFKQDENGNWIDNAIYEIISVDLRKPMTFIRNSSTRYTYSEDGTITQIPSVKEASILFRELPLGFYKIREVSQPKGYLSPNIYLGGGLEVDMSEYANYYAEIKPNSTTTRGYINRTQKGELRITKLNDENVGLEGVEFEILTKDKQNLTFSLIDGVYRYTNNGKITQIKSDKNGFIKVENLPLGDYEIREVSTIKGYLLLENTIDVSFTPNDSGKNILIESIIINKPTRTQISKLNIDREFVEGAQLQLLDGEIEVQKWTTTNKPFEIKGLEIGKTYTLRELKAPEGYLLADDLTITIEETDEIQEYEMIDYKVPEIKTKFADIEGNKEVHRLKEVKLVDHVSYTNLIIGKEYTLNLVVMNKETGEPLTNAEGKVATTTHTFTATKPDGVEEVEITVDLSNYKGTQIVAFERLSYEGVDLAIHEDLEDKEQTIDVPSPEIKTKFADIEGNKEVHRLKEVKLVDHVSYTNLIIGKEYTLNLVVMNKETGEPLTNAEGKVATTTHTFTATKPDGVEEVEITVDLSNYKGTQIVAFERLSYEGVDLAIHEDLEDKKQTIDVPSPEIKTKFADIEGNKEVLPAEEEKLIDHVTYSGLIAGKEYNLTLVIMNKSTEDPLQDKNGNEISVTKTFVPEKAEGIEKVEIAVDLSKLSSTEIVAFETLSYKGIEIAFHKDIEDENQKIRISEIPKEEPPKEEVAKEEPPSIPERPKVVKLKENPKTGDQFPLYFTFVITIAALIIFLKISSEKKNI